MTIRLTVLLSVQLRMRPVMNSLLGTTNSWRFQLVIVVARMRMRETTPLTSPTVTISPTRIGRSASKMTPLTKLATTSCNPKPSPTLRAVTIQPNWASVNPSVLNTMTTPIMKTTYWETVTMA